MPIISLQYCKRFSDEKFQKVSKKFFNHQKYIICSQLESAGLLIYLFSFFLAIGAVPYSAAQQHLFRLENFLWLMPSRGQFCWGELNSVRGKMRLDKKHGVRNFMYRGHFFFIYSPWEINENPRLTLVDFTDTGENVQSEREYFRLGAESYSMTHTRRSDASKKEKKIACPLFYVFACGQVWSPHL